MTDRQRAFICTLVYVFKNKRFFGWHRIGVKRIPDGAKMYEFHGEIKPDTISIQDDRYNRAVDDRFFTNPWGAEVSWIGKRRTDRLKVKSSEGSTSFSGVGTEYSNFDGQYYPPEDKIKIRDYSQDRQEYVYRITW